MRNMWSDGRSGAAGQYVGNLALGRLAEAGQLFSRLRGTTFQTADTIALGRICAKLDYLPAGIAHWANVSKEQHKQSAESVRQSRRKLIYLFLTGDAGRSCIHCWQVPGELLSEVIDEKGKGGSQEFAVHIRQDGARFTIAGHDVTKYYKQLVLSDDEMRRLREVNGDVAPASGSGATPVPPTTSKASGEGPQSERRRFEIPVSVGVVELIVPTPLPTADLTRVKAYIDLVADLLTPQDSEAAA